MKKILQYCKPFLGFQALTLFIKIVGTMMDLLIPYLLSVIIDDVAPTVTKENLAPIFYWGALMLLCAVIAAVTNIKANQRSSFFAKEVTKTVRQDLFDRIMSFSAAQTDHFTIPSLVARMSSDTYVLNHVLGMVFRIGVRAPILLVGGVVLTVSLEPVLALPFVILLPILGVIVTEISKRGIRYYRRKQKNTDAMVEKVRDNFTGVRVIKALSKTDYEKESFGKINLALSQSEEKAGVVTGISGPVISVFLNLGMTAVVVIGAHRVAGGFTAPGQIIAFMSYFTTILNATLSISSLFTSLTRGIASADRIAEVLETERDLQLLPAPEEIPDNPPFLEFRDVSFSYNKKKPNLDHISFTLEKGETLGIIGGIGSGKTTLILLLLRFYDPDEGVILLNGRDIRTLPAEDFRKEVGVVFQNDFLMADTIGANIDFTRRISHEEMTRAAEDAQALSFISEMEEAFLRELTAKGSNLSGGQRQRVLISRALAGDPKLLILDDASSALDYRTDAALRKSLSEHYGDTTCVIVAQRISSIRNADLILVLEQGRVIGKGRDEFLAETCEVYREIAQSQMGEVRA